MGKVKTVDFSDTIAARRYVSIESHCHFFTIYFLGVVLY